MKKTTLVRNCYLVFSIIYLLICFIPQLQGAIQNVMQKGFWIILIGYAVIEFVDNQVRFEEER